MPSKCVASLALLVRLATSNALAVSVFELSGKCGDDAKVYCDGVSYGDAMQECLNANYDELVPACKAVMDRINAGEGVSLL